MELYASNIDAEQYDVKIELRDDEKDLEKGIFEFSLGLSRLVCEFIHLFAQTKEQASALVDVVQSMEKDMIDDYVIGGTFEEVLQSRTESSLYEWMLDTYKTWLKHSKKDEVELLSKFTNANELKLKVYAKHAIVTISLESDLAFEFIDTFDVSDISKDDLEKTASMAYIIAVVLADKIFGDGERNPIRRLKHTDGHVDGGLIEMIHKAIDTTEGE